MADLDESATPTVILGRRWNSKNKNLNSRSHATAYNGIIKNIDQKRCASAGHRRRTLQAGPTKMAPRSLTRVKLTEQLIKRADRDYEQPAQC